MEQDVLKTQSERLSEELKKISVDVTAADRKALEDEKGFVRGTISRYLNGYVNDNDTAVSILTFLRQRITDRENVLKQA